MWPRPVKNDRRQSVDYAISIARRIMQRVARETLAAALHSQSVTHIEQAESLKYRSASDDRESVRSDCPK